MFVVDTTYDEEAVVAVELQQLYSARKLGARGGTRRATTVEEAPGRQQTGWMSKKEDADGSGGEEEAKRG